MPAVMYKSAALIKVAAPLPVNAEPAADAMYLAFGLAEAPISPLVTAVTDAEARTADWVNLLWKHPATGAVPEIGQVENLSNTTFLPEPTGFHTAN